MSMSTLNRRLQILINEGRFKAVEKAAAAEGRSIGEFVRRALDEAIDNPRRAQRQSDVLDLLLSAPRMDLSEAELHDLIEEAHTSTRPV